MARFNRFAAASALAAAFFLAATPVMAQETARSYDRADEAAPPDGREGYSYDTPRRDVGVDRAAQMCVDAVERVRDRVDSVDSVTRDRGGWAVSGALEDGAGFTCRIDSGSRVRGLDFDLGGPRAEAAAPDDRQYDDNDDARARAEEPGPQGDDNQPAWVANRPEWHGDPQQPEPQPQYVPQPQPQPQPKPQPQDDGRYGTSQAPDFSQTI